ncbi:MAG TPA: HEAT repeat domain-containing protein [Vicinamibacteria bacterium]|nr:HEAT repeat domain-containing protein [Vicinamibacteria bacterium]
MNPFVSLFVVAALQTSPTLMDGSLVEHGESRDIAADVLAFADGVWAGYAVPMISGRHSFCGNGIVTLDAHGGSGRQTSSPGAELFVLYRVEAGSVARIRALDSECRIDASGETVHWWRSVSPRSSLEFLETLARDEDIDRSEDAVTAMAFHEEPLADARLSALAATASSHDVREKAVFWLGAARGEGGLRELTARLESETDRGLREKIVFALHVSDAEGATEKLVQIAKSDAYAETREKALFWLAQEAGKLAGETIASAVRNDPELEVKEKAVFALSQLPPDEGVPLLLEVAETHPHPEVRKKAFFWLGQSGDPRAFALFEKILLTR